MDNGIVYHYCKPKVFKKIIDSKKIWLSDMRKSNDYEEIVGMMDKILAALPVRIGEERDLFSPLVSVDFKYEKYLISYVREYWECEISPNALWMAVCFSGAEDDLAQWRGYTERATGFAVGIDVSHVRGEIEKLNNRFVRFGEIIYDKDKHDEYVSYVLGELMTLIRSSEGKREDNIERKLRSAVRKWFSALVRDIAYFKNPSFAQEKEIRLCYSRVIKIPELLNRSTLSALNFLHYNVTDNDVVAHLEVDFPTDVISRIIIGPMNRATPNDVRMLLATCGFKTDSIEIVKSKTPYRV